MDMSMPEMDGPEAIKVIKQENPKARILVLTSFGDSNRVSDAVQAGALGYLLKDSSPDDLLHAIGSVYRGNLVMPQELAVKLHAASGRAASRRSIDRTRNRCASFIGARPVQSRDRSAPAHQYHHGALACEQYHDEAGRLQSHASRTGCAGSTVVVNPRPALTLLRFSG